MLPPPMKDGNISMIIGNVCLTIFNYLFILFIHSFFNQGYPLTGTDLQGDPAYNSSSKKEGGKYQI